MLLGAATERDDRLVRTRGYYGEFASRAAESAGVDVVERRVRSTHGRPRVLPVFLRRDREERPKGSKSSEPKIE